MRRVNFARTVNVKALYVKTFLHQLSLAHAFISICGFLAAKQAEKHRTFLTIHHRLPRIQWLRRRSPECGFPRRRCGHDGLHRRVIGGITPLESTSPTDPLPSSNCAITARVRIRELPEDWRTACASVNRASDPIRQRIAGMCFMPNLWDQAPSGMWGGVFVWNIPQNQGWFKKKEPLA